MKRFVGFFVLTCLAALFIFSCKIGLGEAVDTQPPEIEITAPASDAVIRDSFAFRGTWADDGSIKELSINLVSTDGANEAEYSGVVDKEGTWSCIIDPFDVEKRVPDGTYEATIAITDNALHTTKVSRLITIDNTPPIVVLQRPSSKAESSSSDWDSYGQIFTLEGQAADDNDVEMIEVSIYSDAECTNLLNTIRKTNVPPTISLDVAQFEENVENDYSKIYGSTTKDGTKNFYCKIIAYDAAQRYPADGSEQTEADKNGNSINTYYLYDDISSEVLNSYKITEVYHMMNGSFADLNNENRSAIVASVKDVLSKNTISIGSFTLNPANNPTFLVSGKESLKKDGTDFTANEDLYISNGSTVVVEVSPGLDGISLDGDSLKIYAIQCDVNGEIVSGANRIYPVTTRSKSGSSYKFVTQINTTNSGLIIGNNYLFGVEGTDTGKNPVVAKGKGYGFYFAATGAAPTLVVENPSASITYLKKDSNLLVKGYMTVDAGCPNISINCGDDVWYSYTCNESEGTKITDTQIKYPFSYEIPAAKFVAKNTAGNQISSDFALTIKATNEGVSSYVNKSIMYDIDGPEITVADPTPTGNLYERDASTGLIKEMENPIKLSGVLNGTVSFKVNIGDDFDSVDATTNKPKYEFVQGSNNENGYIANATRDTITLDTTKFNDGKVTLNIYAWDRAGNKTTFTQEYDVDQASDLPAIIASDYTKLKFGLDTTDKVDAAIGANMIAQGGQMTVKITDDDGIANVKVYKRAITNEDPDAKDYDFSESDPNLNNYKDVDKNQSGEPTEVLFALNAPSTAGYFRYKIIATDKGGKTAEVGPFDILTTASAPTITTVIANPAYVSTATQNKITGGKYESTLVNTITISSNQAPFYVFCKTDSSTKWDTEKDRSNLYQNGTNTQYVGKIDALPANPNEYSFNHEGLAPTTTTTYYYIVLDKNWQESNSKSVQGVVDNTQPPTENFVLKNKPTTADTISTVSSFTFQGTASDSNNEGTTIAGVEKIEITISDVANPSKTHTVDATGTNNWVYSLEYGASEWASVFADEGKKKITLRVIDNAGNYNDKFRYKDTTGDKAEVTFDYDKAAPVVTFTDLSAYSTTEKVTLTGTVYDTNELASIVIKDGETDLSSGITYKNGSGATTTLDSAKSDATKVTWTKEITISDLTDGNHTFTVTAVDVVGRSTAVSKSTTIDNTAPVVTLDAYPNIEDTKNNSVQLTGNCSDSSGVNKVELTITDATTSTKTYTKECLISNGKWSCNINYKEAGTWQNVFADEGKKVITLKITDNAGKTNVNNAGKFEFTYDGNTKTSVEFIFDKADPVLGTISGFQEFMPSNGLLLSGSATDSYKLATNALKVTEEFKGKNDTAYSETTASKDSNKNYVTGVGGNTGGNWSNFRIPLGNAAPQEGSYKYTFTLSDEVGHTTTYTSSEIIVDKSDPVVTITNPAGNIYLNANNFEFKGTAQDESRLDEVKAVLIEDGVEQPSKTTTLTPNATHEWAFTQYGLTDKQYSIKVTAKDKAGNSKSVTSSVITVDTTSPTSTVKGTNLFNKDGTSLSAGKALNSTTTYYAKAAYSISGEIIEANYDKSKVTLSVTKDGETLTSGIPAITFSSTDNKTWTIDGLTSTNAVYKYTLKIVDLAGNESEYSFAVTYDNTAPTLTINAPTANELFDKAAITAKGEVHDDGIGLSSIEYSLDDGTNWIALQNVSAGQYSWNVELKDASGNALAEGKYQFKVRAKDILNHETVQGPITFDYDAGKPVFTFANLNEYYKTKSVTLSGTAFDTNKLSSIVIKDNGTDVSTGTTFKNGSGTTVTLDTAKSDATKVTWTKALTNLSDGNHTFTVTATDIANQYSSETKTITVDTQIPEVTLESLPGNLDTRNTSFTFKGSATDATSGVKTLKMKVSAGNGTGAKYREVPVTVGTTWFYTINYADTKAASTENGASGNTWAEVFETEGEKTVTFSYEDYAGNTGSTFTYAGDSKTSETFIYDKAEPELSVDETTVLTYMSSNGFTIKGTGTDSYKLAATAIKVTEEFKKKGTSTFIKTAASGATVTFDNSSTGGNTGGAWSLPVPLNKSGITLEDGVYKYTFTITDSVGNVVSKYVENITVDLTKPVVSVTTPEADSGDAARRGLKAITDTNFGFVGEIVEANELSGVYYKVLTSTQYATASNYAAVAAADVLNKDKWTAAGWTSATISKESGKNIWKTYEEMDEAVGYKIYAYAVDKAGNLSDVTSRIFDVDRSNPVVETKIDGTVYSSSATKVITSQSGYAFTFTASDTLGLDETTPVTVTVSKNGTELTKGTDYTLTKSGSTYQVGFTNQADGLYEYSITAKDKVTKTTSVTRTVRLDTKGPVLQIISPSLETEDYQTTSKVIINGSASDDSAIAGIYYAYNVANPPATGGSWTGWTHAEQGFTSTSWKIKGSGGDGLEGQENSPRKLFIVGVDEHGNIGSTVSKELKIDLYNPSLTTTTTDLYANETFTISAVAADNNGIKEVSISDGTNTYKSTDNPATLTYVTATNTYSRAFTITKGREGIKGSDALEDGEYTITISTTDNAGRNTTKTRLVTVDTISPAIGSVTMTWNDSKSGDVIHNNPNATFSLNPTDTNLDSVEYYINDGSNSAITTATSSAITDLMWSNVPAKVNGATGVVIGYERSYKFSDGVGKVYFKVTDKAGNISYSTNTNTISYKVDMVAPDSCVVETIDGAAPNGTKLINGTDDLAFTVTAKDFDYSYASINSVWSQVGLSTEKVASVNLKSIGGALVSVPVNNGQYSSSSKQWLITIPAEAFEDLDKGIKSITVTVTDTAGNSKDFDIFSIELDNEAPVTTITSPVTGDDVTVNGKLIVSGTTTEDHAKTVTLYYSTAEIAPASLASWTRYKTYTTQAAPASGSDANTTYGLSSSKITNWSFPDFNFNSLSGAADETLKKHDIWLLAYAEDVAGNVSVITNPVKYHVDMDADRPVIKFSNLVLGASMAGTNDSTRAGFENSEVYGSITDDDGVPDADKVFYQIVKKGGSYNASNYVAAAADSNFVYSNGSFTLKFLDANKKADDGIKDIYFKVTDKAGTTFETKTGTTYNQTGIILSDGTNEYGTRPATAAGSTKATVAYIKVDTQAPSVYTESYYLGETASTDEADWSSGISAETFGGNQSKFFLYQYAYDANDVKSLVFRIPTDANDSTSKTPVNGYYVYNFTLKSGETKTSAGVTYTKWLSEQIDVTGFASGTRPCEFVASDGIKSKTTAVNISIDNTPPTVLVDSHTTDEQIRSSFALKGNFQDGDFGTSLKYIISTSAAEPDATAWSNATNVAGVTSMNWRIYFDNDNATGITVVDNETHDKQPKFNIVDLMSSTLTLNGDNQVVLKSNTSTKYTSLVRLYYHFKATDAIGNTSDDYVFSLKIDPQGDIPVILMSYPEVDKDASGNKKYGWYSVTANTPLAAQWFYTNEPGTFGQSRTETVQYKSGEDTLTGIFTYKYRGPTALLSGIIRTIGTAEDDKTISGLYMQIDPTYDPSGEGKFNANWATALAAGNGEYTITSFGPAGNQKQGINMGNRTSWNLAINKNGEFNRSGNNYIAIRLYAVDVDGNVSATEDDDFFIVTIDSGAPKIGSTKQLYVYQYRWVSSSGAVVYTNKQNPAAGDSYYSDSGCRTAAGTIGSVASDGKSITAGGTNYTKDFNINEYIDGMWLKGEWWLSGSVEDENGIKAASMSVDGSTGKSIISGNDTNYNYISANYIAESGKHDYLINYRVGSITSNAYGQIEYTLLVEDGDGQTTSKDFIINYDNKAPTVASNAAEGLAISKEIINDNGSYKVESAATEQSGESGFERVVFYFKRTLTGYKYVYDSYMQKDQATNKWRYEAEGTESVNVVYDADTGLYWKEYTVQDSGGVQGRDVITVSNIDASVHKGTLAKIGGVIYTVTNVSSTSITLDGAPSEDLTGTKVYFVVGHVVDHVGTEGQGTSKQTTKTAYGYGYYSSSDDDGDMMVEKVSTVGTKTTWSGNINSQNIPDGPIEIHYVVFDKAGNSTHEVVSGAFVKNNAPRLASLRVWTDYNGNDKEDETESDTKYYNSRERKIGGKTTQRAYGVTENLVVSGNDLNYDDANATAFKRITDKTRFYPEIVGGNGHLYYSYKIGTGTDPANWNKKTGNGGTTPFTASATRVEADSSAYMATDQNGESYVSGSASDKIEVSTSILSDIGNSPDNGPTWFEYTIWDSTPGTTRYATDGTGSLTAKFTVALKVAYVDTVAPKAVISPFFWKGQGKGTVQNADGTTSQVALNSLYDGDKANGHIELENDLTGTLAATIYGDTDPKVSGKITIRGTAYDDIRLSQLWVKFDGVTLESALTGTNPDSTNHPGYVLAATYNKSTSKWTAATATMSTKGWEFSATDEYCTSDGHKVNWEFSVNTAKHTNVSEKNVKAYVMSVAERGSETAKYSSVTAAGSDPTNDAQYNKPAYQMDIVPYISAIKTSDRTNSGLKDNNIRSASGKYSIIKGNSTSFITVEGFNLNPGASDVRLYTTAQKEASDSTNQTGIQLTRTAANATHTSFSVSNAIANSGYIEVFVNGNRAMNNINKNNAHGSYAFTGGTQATPAPTVSDYKEMPNREADYDVTKNVQLTDDRYLRLFEMHDTGSTTTDGYYPTMIMEGDSPVFSYLNLSGSTSARAGSEFPAYAMPQRAKFNANGTEAYTEYLAKESAGDQMAMARDDDGRFHQISVFNRAACDMYYIYDRLTSNSYNDYWAPGVQIGSGWFDLISDSGNNGLSLECVDLGGVKVGRYMYPKMIAKGGSKNGTASIYVAYYDDYYKNIVFRNFQVGTSVQRQVMIPKGNVCNLYNGYHSDTYLRFNNQNDPKTFDNKDVYLLDGNGYVIGEATPKIYSSNKSYMTISNLTYLNGYSKNDVSKVALKSAGFTTSKVSVSSYRLDSTHKDRNGDTYAQYVNFKESKGWGYADGINESYRAGRNDVITKASKFFAMGVTSTNPDDKRAIIVYYDETLSQLVLAYSDTSVDGSNVSEDTITFSKSTTLEFPPYVGNYVSMAIDEHDGIHIAAFDAGDSDLSYIYLPSYDATMKDLVHYTVDQYGAVGNWTQIKVDSNGHPVIAYTNATENGQRDAIKLAISNGAIGTNAIGSVTAGVDKGTKYTTGGWEYMTVPAITAPQGGDSKFQNVCLDFDSNGKPVVGYLGTNLEFGKYLDENSN